MSIVVSAKHGWDGLLTDSVDDRRMQPVQTDISMLISPHILSRGIQVSIQFAIRNRTGSLAQRDELPISIRPAVKLLLLVLGEEALAIGSGSHGTHQFFLFLRQLLLELLLVVWLHEASLEVHHWHVDAVSRDDLGILKKFVVFHDLVGIEHELRGVAEEGLLTLELGHGFVQGGLSGLRHCVVSKFSYAVVVMVD